MNALEFHAAGRIEVAQGLYRQILAHQPENPIAWHHLGLIAHGQGDHRTAIEHITKAVTLRPDYISALSNLAAVHRANGDLIAAAASAERAIALDPGFAAAHSNRGGIHEDQGDFPSALAAYRQACHLDPYFVEAHANAADLLARLNRHEEALVICDEIVGRRPEAARIYFSAGNILRDLLRGNEAMDAFRQAIALQPRFAEAHVNLGNLLLRQGAVDEAITAYKEALAINPNIAQCYSNLGAAYELAMRPVEALEAYRKGMELNDRSQFGLEVLIYHQRRVTCDWDGLAAAEAQLLARVMDARDPGPPFTFLCTEASHAVQQHVAHLWAANILSPQRFVHHRPAAEAPKRKLKIGYLSSDFHRHATTLLMAELIERHDRSRFEVIGYSHGIEDSSEMRYRIGKAFDTFVDIRDLDDREAAQRIHADGIDILVELKGYTQGARSAIAAHRPAPIQVNYLGYPGTMGCDFIDYVIADPITLPTDQQPFYDEKIVHLPDCYQPNDTRRRVAELTPSRADCGLPEEGFIFCCFNNSYKLTPHVFGIWMRILAAVPGSVLWLFDANSEVRGNIEKEAAKRGIDPATRLVFAPRINPQEHLARQRLADLFLDCLPYNAHTTTSDALWVGLPVITRIGETFPGRVAASLLTAVGLPELVTTSDADYEALAIKLATDPAGLAELRRKLQTNRRTHPLFDTQRYVRHLEAAFSRMWDIWAKGEAPQPFAVAPLAAGETAAAQSAGAAEIARIPYAACPLCGGKDHLPLLRGDGSKSPLYRDAFPKRIEWRTCRSCTHVYADSYFAPDVAMAPAAQLGRGLDEARRAAAAMVSRVAHYGTQGQFSQGPWLDVECGNGARLFTASEWGYEPVALDASQETVTELRRLGIEAHCGTLPDLSGSGRYSVISLAEILPRQPYPKELLETAQRLLRAGGILFLSMANREAMAFQLQQLYGANPHFDEIEHYHLFGRSRLYRLLRDHGFEPIDYQISPAHKIGMEVIARKIGQ